ncbi:MAG: hypothetical protein ACE5Q3_14260, partial [Alphaproteobacteria bacterium]
ATWVQGPMGPSGRIVKAVFSSGPTWLALAIVAGLEAAFYTWFQPSPVMGLAVLALGLLSATAWTVLFVRTEGFVRRLYRQPEELEAAQQEKLRTLVSDFDDLDFAQGAAQLQRLREKFENLSEVMKRRLNAGELTYARYLGMAEQVYLSALDNLHEAAVALRSVSTIDPDYVEARISELEEAPDPSADRRQESDALRKRTALYTQQQQRVEQLISQNELAMTVLDKTSTALAEVKTGKGHAAMDAEAAIAELERLAKRAGDYAIAE